MSHNLERVAESLVADGKGILAADETTPTLTKRFDTLGITSTEQSRRTYREMLFTSPGAADFISGAIMYDETIRQKTSGGMPFAKELESQGILPGIKVDTGAKPFAASPDETVTEGLDGLRDRLREYRRYGRPLREVAGGHSCNRLFAKRRLCECKRARAWLDMLRSVRSRTWCRSSSLKCSWKDRIRSGAASEVTSVVLHAVFDALFEQGVVLEAMLLKPNMVIAGKQCAQQASVEQVADATLTLLAPARAGGRPRDRISVGRATRALSDGASQRNKPDREHEALEDQFLLRAGASRSGARRMAWTRRVLCGWSASLLPPSLPKWSGDSRQIHREMEAVVRKRRRYATRPRLARRLISATAPQLRKIGRAQ